MTRETAEQINPPLGVVLTRVSPQLSEKIKYSITLLRKAQPLMLAYDPQDGAWLAFSGGKDSQALYHIAKLAEVPFKAHFSPTSVDPPQLVRFIRSQYPSVEFGKLECSIFEKAVQRQILPTMRVRWCCADFKESAGAGKVTLIGIRRAESARRAKRNEVEVSSKKFSGSLDELDDYRDARNANKRTKKSNVTIVNAKGEHTLGCIHGKESLLISPILNWTADDVWEFLNVGIQAPHCELYDQGYTRIGCILCPMSSPKSKQRDIEHFPHVKEKWIQAIMAIRMGKAHLYDKLPSLPPIVAGYIWWNCPIGPTIGIQFERGKLASSWQSTSYPPSFYAKSEWPLQPAKPLSKHRYLAPRPGFRMAPLLAA